MSVFIREVTWSIVDSFTIMLVRAVKQFQIECFLLKRMGWSRLRSRMASAFGICEGNMILCNLGLVVSQSIEQVGSTCLS